MSRRLWAGLGVAAIAGAIALLIVGSLKDNLVYFLTPSELETRAQEIYDTPVRLGGQVVPGSVSWEPQTRLLAFSLTDGRDSVRVRSTGAPPAMFQEGQGVVVEGRYHQDGVFESRNLMVKHSNEYHPPKEGQKPQQMYESLIQDGGADADGGAAPPGEGDATGARRDGGTRPAGVEPGAGSR